MNFNAGSRLISDPFQNYLEDDEFGNTFTKRKSYIYGGDVSSDDEPVGLLVPASA